MLGNTNSNTNTNYTTLRTPPPLRAPSSPPLPASRSHATDPHTLRRAHALAVGSTGVTDTAVDTADDVVIRRLG